MASGATNIYLPEYATITAAKQMTETEMYFSFKLDSGKPLGHMPGQFAEVSLPGIGEAPISISSSPGSNGTFEMVIRKIGNVTNKIHTMKQGEKIGIRGPFGTTFPVETAMKGKDIVFICAGLGIVPLRSAIQYVMENRKNYGKVTILSGTRTPSQRLFIDELKKWAAIKDVTVLETVDIAEDGWTGNVGVITTLFSKVEIDPAKTIALIVGPPVMYKFAILELRKYNMKHQDIYVSLERHMKCGVGKCGHCQINNLYCCQDGPVFSYADIENIREAI
ncbi:MAG: FAD/NAD(P)-binding protein [Spirochaetales bacterium]|nr:FAD/NAD(P)-binding protein [Spirochaetales bacterium]